MFSALDDRTRDGHGSDLAMSFLGALGLDLQMPVAGDNARPHMSALGI
jgi:hypothetical protein